MRELSASFEELDRQFGDGANNLIRNQEKVSWLAGGVATETALASAVDHDEPFEFSIFDAKAEVAGRYFPRMFTVDSKEVLTDNSEVYLVRSLGNTCLLSREFMVVEPSRTNGRIPGEVSYVSFCAVIEPVPVVDILV